VATVALHSANYRGVEVPTAVCEHEPAKVFHYLAGTPDVDNGQAQGQRPAPQKPGREAGFFVLLDKLDQYFETTGGGANKSNL
jgi:hypothetical protein